MGLFLLMVKGHQLRVVLLLIDNPFIQQVRPIIPLPGAWKSISSCAWPLLSIGCPLPNSRRNRLPVDGRGDPSLYLGTRGPIVPSHPMLGGVLSFSLLLPYPLLCTVCPTAPPCSVLSMVTYCLRPGSCVHKRVGPTKQTPRWAPVCSDRGVGCLGYMMGTAEPCFIGFVKGLEFIRALSIIGPDLYLL